MGYDDISEELTNYMDSIKEDVVTGRISLLELELNPIFNQLKESLSVYNIFNYSQTYQQACDLLSLKFEELKNLLNHLDNDEIFMQFLKSNPNDNEIEQILGNCWRTVFHLESISPEFMSYSNNRFSKDRVLMEKIEHIRKEQIGGSFLLEIPKQKFTEKMMDFYKKIKKKLPCKFDELFDEIQDQLEVYEYFVYILHLLQIGLLKYQKITTIIYE
jgi:chromatin segregation and condensation protein Rec8/ScpA/Scc1 (kleisin family)